MPDSPTVIATYTAAYEAEIAQSHLEESGIDAFISKDDAGGMDPQMQLTRGVRLLVRQHEADEAVYILKEMDAMPARKEGDPTAEAGDQGKMWRELGTALLVMGAVVLIISAVLAGGVPSELGTVFWSGVVLAGVGAMARIKGRASGGSPTQSASA